jgi:hypothetical protein
MTRLNDDVYVFGGFNSGNIFASESYSLVHNVWVNLPDLPESMETTTAVAVKN